MARLQTLSDGAPFLSASSLPLDLLWIGTRSSRTTSLVIPTHTLFVWRTSPLGRERMWNLGSEWSRILQNRPICGGMEGYKNICKAAERKRNPTHNITHTTYIRREHFVQSHEQNSQENRAHKHHTYTHRSLSLSPSYDRYFLTALFLTLCCALFFHCKIVCKRALDCLSPSLTLVYNPPDN
jgi:hypothetical protein